MPASEAQPLPGNHLCYQPEEQLLVSCLQAKGDHWKLEDFTNRVTGKQSKSITLDAGGTLITINPGGHIEHGGQQASSQSIKPSRLQSMSSRPSEHLRGGSLSV